MVAVAEHVVLVGKATDDIADDAATTYSGEDVTSPVLNLSSDDQLSESLSPTSQSPESQSPREHAPTYDHDVTEKGADFADSGFKTPEGQVLSEYDQWADNYEHDTDKVGFASPTACVDTFLEFCPPEGKRVLDIGAGTGLLAKLMWERGRKADVFDGMDLSPKMLENLVKKGIYNDVKAHDMTQYPWPFPSNHYDGSMCNGVLIYVNDPNCLEEFVRVVKPGGFCVIMFRHDGYPSFEKKDLDMRAAGKWELVHKTPDMRNFACMEFDAKTDIIFNQWVYRILEDSA